MRRTEPKNWNTIETKDFLSEARSNDDKSEIQCYVNTHGRVARGSNVGHIPD